MAHTSGHSSTLYRAVALVHLVFALVLLGLLSRGAESTNVGVCYGMIADNLPPPSEVVDLYKSNGIRRMRIFFPAPNVFAALRDSGIEVILDVPRENLRSLASDPNAAAGWVRDNVLNNYPAIRFRYIAVGNEVIPDENSDAVLPAMRNVRAALDSAGIGDKIRVSTVIHTGTIQGFPPSQGVFSDKAVGYMRDIASFLASNGAPLLANVYPYFSYVGNPKDISAAYALFTSPQDVVTDGNLRYQNLFDAILDTVYAALEKVGAGGVEVVVTETGWPSAGGPDAATVDNARTYNNNLIRHVSGGGGTPRRPGKEVEAYIFAMFNENQKKPQGIENNFGLFFPNKQPVYPIQI